MSMHVDSLPSLEAVCGLAERAAAAIMAVYGRADFRVEYKADNSPVTEADLASNRIIIAGLRALTPDIPILTEESSDIDWEERRRWSRYWLVDPLDGTRDFLKRNGEFTVNIALIEGHRSVMGVVQAPASGDLYFASIGHGAHMRRRGQAAALRTREPSSPVVVASSRSHGNARQAHLLSGIGEYTQVAMGSSLKFCLLAAGEADLYLRTGATGEWDTAAAQCVLEQAGGAVVRLDGAPLVYNAKPSLINPEFMAVGDPACDWPARLAH